MNLPKKLTSGVAIVVISFFSIVSPAYGATSRIKEDILSYPGNQARGFLNYKLEARNFTGVIHLQGFTPKRNYYLTLNDRDFRNGLVMPGTCADYDAIGGACYNPGTWDEKYIDFKKITTNKKGNKTRIVKVKGLPSGHFDSKLLVKDIDSGWSVVAQAWNVTFDIDVKEPKVKPEKVEVRDLSENEEKNLLKDQGVSKAEDIKDFDKVNKWLDKHPKKDNNQDED